MKRYFKSLFVAMLVLISCTGPDKYSCPGGISTALAIRFVDSETKKNYNISHFSIIDSNGGRYNFCDTCKNDGIIHEASDSIFLITGDPGAYKLIVWNGFCKPCTTNEVFVTQLSLATCPFANTVDMEIAVSVNCTADSFTICKVNKAVNRN